MLPSIETLTRIQQQIFRIPNKRKESKRKNHYGLFLLCYGAGLRVSEAVNFDLTERTHQGLYRLNKTKGKKKRYVYIPKAIISELKANNWRPCQTNRFNFYHFLRKIKREVNFPANTELTPHTLRRAFATYHAENGLPLPLLQKILGHSSIRTTALYWMNIYNDGNNDTDDILAAKNWLEKPKKLQPEPAVPAKVNLDELPTPLVPNFPLFKSSQSDYLSKINHLEEQLSQIQWENNNLKAELSQAREQNADLQQDLSEQNTILRQEKTQAITEKQQIQQELAAAKETIHQLEQKLTATKNNLTYEKQNNQSLKEINTNLASQIQTNEQNYTNLHNAYQNTLKDKQAVEKQLNQLTNELKNFARFLSQCQKLHYYQQQEKQNEFKAQIVQPPPWKPNK